VTKFLNPFDKEMIENYKVIICLKSVLILTLISNTHNSSPIDISGHGWHSPQLIFNSRYFFVKNQLIDKVLIKSPDSGCRIWHQILNETNFGETNLTIVRYKLLTEVCSGGFEIQLIADDKVLARKVVVEDIYSENCICLRNDWKDLMKCNQMTQQFEQIDRDLRFD